MHVCIYIFYIYICMFISIYNGENNDNFDNDIINNNDSNSNKNNRENSECVGSYCCYNTQEHSNIYMASPILLCKNTIENDLGYKNNNMNTACDQKWHERDTKTF